MQINTSPIADPFSNIIWYARGSQSSRSDLSAIRDRGYRRTDRTVYWVGTKIKKKKKQW